MVPLVTVGNVFSARVLAARLGSEGIVTSLAGAVDGPYPFGDVHVSVDADDLDLARQLLLADEVEAALGPVDDGVGYDDEAGGPPLRIAGLHPYVAAGAAVFVAVASSLARVLTL
jgi:hypothetical protein